MKTKYFLNMSITLYLAAAFLLQAAAQTTPATDTYRPLAGAGKKFAVKAHGTSALLAPGGYHGQGTPPTIQSFESYLSFLFGSGSATTTISHSDYGFKNPMGEGFRVGGGISRVINDFINLGLDGEYVLGSQVTENYITTSKTISRQTSPVKKETERVNYTMAQELTYNYRIFNVIPNITFKAISKPDYYIYNRLGLIIGIPAQLSYTTTQAKDSTGVILTERRVFNLEKEIGLGYQAALGVQFRINESLRGFVELVAANQQVKTNKATLSQFQKENSRVNSFQEVNIDDYKASEKEKTGLNWTMPVHAVGLSLGLALRL